MSLFPRPNLAVRRAAPTHACTDTTVAPEYPWWTAEADAAGATSPPSAPLAGSHTVDVVIVGGGYTGLWTALALSECAPDRTVTVLEAGSCGSGASGRNGGFLHGYWTMFSKLTDLLGPEAALFAARAGSRAQEAILRFGASRPEDLWVDNSGIGVIATTAAQRNVVADTLSDAEHIPPEFQPRPMDRAELEGLTGSHTFHSGALFPEGATLQPMRLLHAMKNAAIEAGVRIHEDSPVVEVRPGEGGGEPTTLRTPLGTVRCRDVVLAANAWLSQTRPYSRHLTNLGSYVVVTEPVPEALRRTSVRPGPALKDARMFLHWTRTTPDDRIVVGTGAGPMSYGGRVSAVHSDDRACVARCVEALHRFYPNLGQARIEHAWGGPVDMSADRMPFFGTLPNSRIHYGLGFSGHGVNAAWIGGQVLASLATGSDDEWTRSPFLRRRVPRLPPEPLRYLGGKVIHSNSLAVEDSRDRGQTPHRARRVIAAIPRVFGLRIGLR